MEKLKNHNLVTNKYEDIIVENRACRDKSGKEISGLNSRWIFLNNEAQFNSYTTKAVKEVILAFREASNDRSVVAVVFTGKGNKAFCTGGNTKEYAEYYAGNPQEYSQYMRLFNDMVSAILMCEKPVICRVNGMRIAGGQEIGMACDFSIAQDLARFGQAGPRHGSAAIGGATDFLHLFVGIERAMYSLTLCEQWTAHQALHYGMLSDIAPALKVDGKFIANPLVITDRITDEFGRMILGHPKTGKELESGKELMKRGTIDLSRLDDLVQSYITAMLYTFPNCLHKTLSEVRKKKLEHWDRNKESSREWLALNMMTEAKAGFRAFNEGPKHDREIDFISLRKQLAGGEPWSDELIRRVSPQFHNVNEKNGKG